MSDSVNGASTGAPVGGGLDDGMNSAGKNAFAANRSFGNLGALGTKLGLRPPLLGGRGALTAAGAALHQQEDEKRRSPSSRSEEGPCPHADAVEESVAPTDPPGAGGNAEPAAEQGRRLSNYLRRCTPSEGKRKSESAKKFPQTRVSTSARKSPPSTNSRRPSTKNAAGITGASSSSGVAKAKSKARASPAKKALPTKRTESAVENNRKKTTDDVVEDSSLGKKNVVEHSSLGKKNVVEHSFEISADMAVRGPAAAQEEDPRRTQAGATNPATGVTAAAPVTPADGGGVGPQPPTGPSTSIAGSARNGGGWTSRLKSIRNSFFRRRNSSRSSDSRKPALPAAAANPPKNKFEHTVELIRSSSASRMKVRWN